MGNPPLGVLTVYQRPGLLELHVTNDSSLGEPAALAPPSGIHEPVLAAELSTCWTGHKKYMAGLLHRSLQLTGH